MNWDYIYVYVYGEFSPAPYLAGGAHSASGDLIGTFN